MTLKPLNVPDSAPEAAKQRAAEFALGVADIALMFRVSKQTAYDWARGGRITPVGLRTVLPSLRPPGGKQEPLRFRLEDAATFSREHELPMHVELLPLALQRRLQVGAFLPGQLIPAVVDDELISESAAARDLGISRSLLQKIRGHGRLNPAITVSGTKYSQLDVWRVADGDLELELPTPPEDPSLAEARYRSEHGI